MKKTIYSLLALALMGAVSSSCSDLLELESETSITNSWLYETPEGLSRAVVGLYDMDRKIAENPGDASDCYATCMFDYCTDLMVFRAGTAAAMARLVNYTPSNGVVSGFWNHHYNVIGKANEVIAAAEAMDLTDPQTLRAWAEAKFFRGRAYFELWKRYERLYLNTEATNIDNLEREFTPAPTEKIFEVIRQDLDDAAANLDWALPDGSTGAQYGRVTKGTAMHVRAQVAMWDEDWDKAIELCEEVLGPNSGHKLEKAPEDVFLNSADLRSKEMLWSYQFSVNPGGGTSGTPPVGHRYQLVTLAHYGGLGDYFELSAEYGGYGWGRCYPNTYLISLFDQEKDTRFTKLMTSEWIINKKGHSAYGQVYDLENAKGNKKYIQNVHTSTRKFYDCWSNADQPDLKSSYKDLPIYRLGETVLMCAEAYLHRDGEGSARALELYNMTWERAGNTKRVEPLTMAELLDEYARECNFEGVRWPLLKRLGLLATQVMAHNGDSKKDDPYLDADYCAARTNFVEGKHEIWPIPQTQVDLMGADFPQHEVWM